MDPTYPKKNCVSVREGQSQQHQQIVTMPASFRPLFNSSNTSTSSIPAGLATLVRATEDLRQTVGTAANHNHHLHSSQFNPPPPLPPPSTTAHTATAAAAVNSRMMNNLAEPPNHHQTTYTNARATATGMIQAPTTLSVKPPRIEAVCHRCGYEGTDIVIRECGCAFHARCIPWPWHSDNDSFTAAAGNHHHIHPSNNFITSETSDKNITTNTAAVIITLIHSCPACKSIPCTLVLQPMNFNDLDEARKQNLIVQGNKKKKTNTGSAAATAHAAESHRGKRRRMGNSTVMNTLASQDPIDDDDLDVSMILGDMNTTNSTNTNMNVKTFTTRNIQSSTNYTKTTSSSSSSLGTTSIHADADCRVGRWSEEETKFCNKLMAHFMAGQFPLLEGTKLNEFLANVLKLKQSRLTKKMKNAALAAKHFSRTTASIPTVQECIDFSAIEHDFLKKLTNPAEAADLKFHMQLFWRDSFTAFCNKIHQRLDAREWLTSVEEMERRASYMKDAARMAKRKLYMGCALDLDKLNPDMGIFIDSDPLTRQNHAASILENSIHSSDDELDDFVSMIATDPSSASTIIPTSDPDILSRTTITSRILGRSNIPSLFSDNCNSWHYSSPFLAKVLVIIHRLCLPFEYLEAWVPSESSGDVTSGCRLYFAGNAITESCVSPISTGSSSTPAAVASSETSTFPLSPDDRFNLLCFGDYSEKFSFQIGSGLPGRVYATGVPIWEQNISEADKSHFERCGAAKLFGIRTALGIPVPSPTVGRIILVLYSQHDRPRDNTMVFNLVEEVVKLLPSPRWKLYIDVGKDNSTGHSRARRSKRTAASTRNHHKVFPSPAKELPHSVAATVNHSASTKSQASSELLKTTAEITVPPSDLSPWSKNTASNSTSYSNLKGNSDRSSLNMTNLKEELVSILGEHMPLDASSEFAFCLPGFMSLRLLLLKSHKTEEEEEIVTTILNSFASFRSTMLSDGETAMMLTRDFLYLKQMQSRAEPQNSVASVLQQWSNSHSQQHTGPSLLHPQLESNNVPFSVPSVSNFSFTNGMQASDRLRSHSFDILHSESDHINPSQHSFPSSDVRFPQFR